VEQPEIEILVSELETAVDRLRSLYEQYFMGFEKLEPAVPRKDVDRKIHVLRKEHFRNTAMRFRFQMILQRYNTYQTHWQRVLREIEAGTYKRHVLRAERRFGDSSARRSAPPPPLPAAPPALPQPGAELSRDVAAQLAELDLDFDSPGTSPGIGPPSGRPTPGPPAPRPNRSVASPLPPRPTPSVPSPLPPRPIPALRPAAPPAVPPARPAPAAPAVIPASAAVRQAPPPAPLPPRPAPVPLPRSDEGLSDERVRQIYAQYVDAKRRQNESTAAITYENVARSLRESSSKLQQKHGKKVDFEVTVKDGKTILKPILK
jgi:hypothetical protein